MTAPGRDSIDALNLRWLARCACLVATVSAATGILSARPQQPSFRTATDLIAVDVQVINRQGLPILGLGADRFEVSLNGRKRNVVSAQLIRYDNATATARLAAPAAPSGVAIVQPDSAVADRPRVFILAVDTWSFDVGTSKGMMAAAKTFVERLQPTDFIGLFSYPVGPQLDPTTDHATVMSALDKVIGGREPPPGNRFRLTPSELVDGGASAAMRICRSSSSNVDPNCQIEVMQEARSLAGYFEMIATESLGRLRDLIRALASLDRRKTLVLLSGGMPVSDRIGGRPDIGDLGILVGQEAARANTAVYTLFVDWKFLEGYSAASTRASLTPLRESAMNSLWLDQFSGTAGGKLFTVSAGNGTFAFDRILTETSSYYLLGVEPEDADRDGKPRQLGVKVKEGGATVRARMWAIVPKRE